MSHTENFDAWLSLLVDWELEPDPAKRIEAARALLRMLAASLSSGLDLPIQLRSWLGQRLREAATTGDATSAFRLRPGRGRLAEYKLHMRDAAQLHSVMQWHARGLHDAAAEIEALPGRLSSSNLAKRFERIAKSWSTTGPYTVNEDGSPSLQFATQADLKDGKPVAVVIAAKAVSSRRFVLLVPRDLGDLAPPARPRSVRK